VPGPCSHRAWWALCAADRATHLSSRLPACVQARLTELESELDNSRHEHRTFGSACAAKDRDTTRRLAGLQDEVEQLSAQVGCPHDRLKARSEHAATNSLCCWWIFACVALAKANGLQYGHTASGVM
jgi:hypothetical protein